MASEHRPTVLVDANVIFSGFRGSGPPSQIVRLASEAFSLLVTDEVINEVLRNIARKAPLALVEVEEWFDDVAVQVWEVLPAAIREFEGAFSKDAHIAAAAISVRPDYVCTGDLALRARLNSLSGAPKALSPRELLDLLTL